MFKECCRGHWTFSVSFFRVAASVKSKMKHSNGLSSKIFKKGNNKDEGAKNCLFYNYGKLQKKVFWGNCVATQ